VVLSATSTPKDYSEVLAANRICSLEATRGCPVTATSSLWIAIAKGVGAPLNRRLLALRGYPLLAEPFVSPTMRDRTCDALRLGLGRGSGTPLAV